MASFIPVAIWIIGALISYIVLRKRGVKISLLWNITIAIAGPLAIPFALLVKPNAK
jgi:hypothetical protein